MFVLMAFMTKDDKETFAGRGLLAVRQLQVLLDDRCPGGFWITVPP